LILELYPRNCVPSIPIEVLEAALQFLALALRNRDIDIVEAVPELLDQFETPLRRQLARIDSDIAHGQKMKGVMPVVNPCPTLTH
jgi:hypothetical protein